jgi:hypothetical protein
MTNNISIKVGDFVTGFFNKSRFYGEVLEIKRSVIVVDSFEGVGMYDFTTRTYPSFKKRNVILNIRKINTIEKIEK